MRFGEKIVEGTVKSKASDRKLPRPDNLAATLKAAKSLQAADKLSLGAAYQSTGYVVVDEAGRPLSPHALTSRWARMLVAWAFRRSVCMTLGTHAAPGCTLRACRSR
jgi:hypothetical protein